MDTQSEFLTDEQRNTHIAALQTELEYLHQSGKRDTDIATVEAEIKRLGGAPGKPADKPAPTEEADGEFVDAAQRAQHIASLKDELRGAEAAGDKARVKDVKAELQRLAGKPAKTKAELDEQAAADAENTKEIDGELA